MRSPLFYYLITLLFCIWGPAGANKGPLIFIISLETSKRLTEDLRKLHKPTICFDYSANGHNYRTRVSSKAFSGNLLEIMKLR